MGEDTKTIKGKVASVVEPTGANEDFLAHVVAADGSATNHRVKGDSAEAESLREAHRTGAEVEVPVSED